MQRNVPATPPPSYAQYLAAAEQYAANQHAANAPSTRGRIDHFPKKTGLVLGSIQLTCGVLCIIFNIIGILAGSYLCVIAHGIWCGCVFVIAGSFGLGAAFAKTKCLIMTFMVLSIIAACLAPVVLVISAIGLYRDVIGSTGTKDGGAMNGLLVSLSVVEGIAAIISAGICCNAYCCCTQQKVDPQCRPTVIYVGAGNDDNHVILNPQTLQPLQPAAEGVSSTDRTNWVTQTASASPNQSLEKHAQ